MILKEALLAIPRRCRRPGLLALFFVSSALAVMALLHRDPMLDQARSSLTRWDLGRQVVQSVLECAFVAFGSPFFWQWTGDQRRQSRGWRGLWRALIACALFQALTGLATLGRDLQGARVLLPEWLVGPFLLINFLGSLAWMLLVGFLIASWETRRADRDEARRQTEEAKWTLLKAQMSPHLLLNSLNSLVQLTREDPAAAAQGMQDLGEIYRRLLDIGDAPRIPLGEERRFLERYLAVEQLRFGDRLRVEWRWDEALDARPTLPLLLQPLVENAVKHGVGAHASGGIIRIHAFRDGMQIHLNVANTTPVVPAAAPGTGVGLRNLKARLDLAYGEKARLKMRREDGWTHAELSLPMEG